MKRHKNWQEWGKIRALQHGHRAVVFELVHKDLLDLFYEPKPLWDLLREKNGKFRPFFGGSEMRVPLQYVKIGKEDTPHE
jgi:hypothetical protein